MNPSSQTYPNLATYPCPHWITCAEVGKESHSVPGLHDTGNFPKPMHISSPVNAPEYPHGHTTCSCLGIVHQGQNVAQRQCGIQSVGTAG